MALILGETKIDGLELKNCSDQLLANTITRLRQKTPITEDDVTVGCDIHREMALRRAARSRPGYGKCGLDDMIVMPVRGLSDQTRRG